MNENNIIDVIIVGGSYSGLAAAMALGRALKNVLIINDGKPCNSQTPYSHNFITHDGTRPLEIALAAKMQVQKYETVNFLDGLVTSGIKTKQGFQVQVASGETFAAKKIIFATGIKDIMPAIDGFIECWGISVLHCPYCHGYEVRNEKTGIVGNGEQSYEFTKLISNWTKDLTLFTNGPSTLTVVQASHLQKHQISIIEKEIIKFAHDQGQVHSILFSDGSAFSVAAIYAPVTFEQHCDIPKYLGCELTDDGYIKIDALQETTVSGVFACGDNASRMRTVANAVAMGTTAGMTVSKKMILEEF